MSGCTLDGLSDVGEADCDHYWAMANSPMYLGGDLTKLDNFAKSAFTNDDSSSSISPASAVQVTGGPQPRLDVEASGRQYPMLPSTI